MSVEHTANLHRTALVDRYATDDRGSRLGRWRWRWRWNSLRANEDTGKREATEKQCELTTRVRRDLQMAWRVTMTISRTAQTGDAVR